MSMPVRLIIFDLDGTLIDSIGDITDAVNYALEPYALLPATPAETSGMVGDGAAKLLERVLERRNRNLDLAALSGRFVEYYSAHIVKHTRLYPGVRETLEFLKPYRKALISNKFAALTSSILKIFNIAPCFELVLGSDTLKERKPSPVPILHTLSTLGVGLDEALIVGDSDVDVAAGRAARIRTVAVTYGYGKPGFEDDADFTAASIFEVASIVESLG
jgi:phosphoglycolate phosphatase